MVKLVPNTAWVHPRWNDVHARLTQRSSDGKKSKVVGSDSDFSRLDMQRPNSERVSPEGQALADQCVTTLCTGESQISMLVKDVNTAAAVLYGLAGYLMFTSGLATHWRSHPDAQQSTFRASRITLVSDKVTPDWEIASRTFSINILRQAKNRLR